MIDVEKKIRQHLIDAGVENVFTGTEKNTSPGVNQQSVFVAMYGGRPTEFTLNDGPRYHRTRVQLLVRSKPREEEPSKHLALEVYDLLAFSSPEGLVQTKAMQTPVRLGADNNDVFRWSINIEVDWQDEVEE